MAKVVERPAEKELYETDFHAWAAQQSELLRTRRFDELDLDHLIEEVADLGVSERHAVMSGTRQILEHFLKLEHSPASDPRRGWVETVATQRSDLEETLSPRLRHELAEEFARVYQRAKREAGRGLRPDRVPESQLPKSCPYGVDQVLDPDWLPKNRHGLDDQEPVRRHQGGGGR